MKFISKKILLFMILFIFISMILFIPYRTGLIFYEENTTNIKAYLPLKKEDKFEIIFKHSIHLTDVMEKYVITDNLNIKQYEMVYEEFGIGMPSSAEGGEELVYKEGKYHLTNINNIFPSINIRNGKTVSEHRLVWGDKDKHMVWFNQYFLPGSWFTVKVKKLSLWQLMKGEKIHD
jgi:hypothetical protein